MDKRKKILRLTIAAVLIVYAAVAYSPIRAAIGRRSPATASLFSPFLLNFSHTYESGRVLEFGVGMSKDELFKTLSETYAGRADLTVNCRVTTGASLLRITPDLDIRTAYGGGDRLCTRLDARRLKVIFEFGGDVVSAINVYFVRTESI